MRKLTEIYTIRFSEKQAETLRILKEYDVNISHYLQLILEKKYNENT